jgi:hypothetical protein
MIVPINEVIGLFHSCNNYIVKKYGHLMIAPHHLEVLEQVWYSDQGVIIDKDDNSVFKKLEFASEEDFLIWAVRWA